MQPVTFDAQGCYLRRGFGSHGNEQLDGEIVQTAVRIQSGNC